MTSIFVQIIIFMVILVGLMIASIWYMNFLLKRIIGNKHEAIEFILSTSTTPIEWSKKYNQKMVAYDKQGGRADDIARVQKRALRVYLRKIDKLIRYMNMSTLVDDEHTRKDVISQLKHVRRQWEKGEDLGWTSLESHESS